MPVSYLRHALIYLGLLTKKQREPRSGRNRKHTIKRKRTRSAILKKQTRKTRRRKKRPMRKKTTRVLRGGKMPPSSRNEEEAYRRRQEEAMEDSSQNIDEGEISALQRRMEMRRLEDQIAELEGRDPVYDDEDGYDSDATTNTFISYDDEDSDGFDEDDELFENDTG